MQNEITKPSNLLDEKGELVQKGWARKLLMKYNRENIRAGWSRIKEWDSYNILCPNYGIGLTIADVGYLALGSTHWLDFNEHNFTADDQMNFFSKGSLNMPRTSEEGDISYSNEKVKMSFKRLKDRRILTVDNPHFMNGKGIKGELTLLQDPTTDTMVIATPWKKKPTRFYYNQKINCMPTKGTIQLGTDYYEFDENTCFTVLDWGRGVWTYKNEWYWGNASGKLADGTKIGWNIGYGFGDTSAASENMIFYDGKAHKFDNLTFDFDPKDHMKPWKFVSNDGRFNVTCEPALDRSTKTNFVILKTQLRQIFGRHSGIVVLDDGTEVQVDNIMGFAEWVKNRW